MTTLTDRTPRTERGQRTRERLVAAARAVFDRQGFAAARMGDIAAAAGVSHGTVYTYFTTKEDVLAAVVAEVVDDLLDSIHSVDLADPVGRIGEANARYLAAFGANARLLQVAEEASFTDPRFTEILDTLRRTHVDRVTRQIERQQRDGTAFADVDARIAAASLCAMVEGFSRHWTDLATPEDPAGHETLTRLWQRALGLPGTTNPRTVNRPLEESDGIHR